MLEGRTPAREDRSAASIGVPAVLAGLVAAVAGGVIWGLIVKWSDYEVGFVAWGIGFLCGMAVLAATRGARGIPFQGIAIVCALLGIVTGKYLAFVWIVRDAADFGDLPIFSSDTLDLFRDNLGIVFDWIDLLWAGLAVYTAWRVLQPEAPEPVETTPEVERSP
jgi:hypothetical protein